ncbi:MAG: S8 family serine peptidase [Candidatus Falkowbacteria bacterium]
MPKKFSILMVGAVIIGAAMILGGIVLAVEVPAQATDNSPALVEAGIVMAPNGNGKEMARVMADTTGIMDKLIFKMRGCQIIHELSDATALKCPANIVSKLKVREDPVLHIMDMEANVQINADDVWASGYEGTGITIAVLDTGIDTDHPELVSSIAGGKGFGYATFEDDHGHGTHVSGIITADGVGGTPLGFAKGAAPDAGVWMAKVCNAQGSCYTSDIAAAIEYVAKGTDGIIGNGDEPAKTISISLGGGGTSRANCDGDYLAQKVNWAVNNGVTVVAAAGNISGKVSSPGCASKAIAVGAVSKTDVRASWSGTGLALDIMAPGVSIYSSIIDDYVSWPGTSMATPHISATVALLRQVNSALTDSQIKDALYKTAKDLGATGWDKYYGWGRVDALLAVNYVKPPEPECIGDENCNDGLSCNGTETCSTGVCQPGITVDCSALSDQCNTGVCDETFDQCIAQPKPNGTSCDDGLYCNTGETCQVGVCTGGSSRVCNDEKVCTTDSCSEEKDMCEYLWPSCGILDSCCGPECSSVNDSDCAVAVKCWSGTNQYLYRAVEQARKFCKCAQGTYGYNSYKYNWSTKTVYEYSDTGNNANWDVNSLSSRNPVYSVTCTDSKAYPTNVDYTYPK